MTGKQYMALQSGMYVSDQTSLMKRDYCTVQEFNRMGQMRLQPLDEKGQPKGESYWIHYKEYDLKEKRLKFEFIELTV